MALVAVKGSANVNITAYDLDPDDSTATQVAWVPMQDYKWIVATFVRTVGTGALDVFNISAATDSSGTGVTAVIAHAVGSEPDAVGDYIHLEATSAMILEALADATHVSVVTEFATSTDEGVVAYVRGGATFPQLGLSADSVA